MIKRIIAMALCVMMVSGSMAMAQTEPEMETVYSKDFSQVGNSYDITNDGWYSNVAPTYSETHGLVVSDNDPKITYTGSLGAKYQIKLDNYHYMYNKGQIYFNTNVTGANDSVANGYRLYLDGQYGQDKNLTVILYEHRNGVSKELFRGEPWSGRNYNMTYDITISFDRGQLDVEIVNATDSNSVYEVSYDLTQDEEGNPVECFKTGSLRIIGGNGLLRLKAIEVKAVKSNLEANYLGTPFKAAAMYNASEPMIAQIGVNKELSEISAVSCYIDGTEQVDMAYKNGEFKSNIAYEDNKFKLSLPATLPVGIHNLKVAFTDEFESKKEYEGKFYVGTHYIALNNFSLGGETEVTALEMAEGETLNAELSYSGIENITGIACLYNSDGVLEKISYSNGVEGIINILCDIPENTAGYRLSVYTCESLTKSAPLSFVFELE